MDIIVLPLSTVSIFTIIFIIAALIFALYKKWMMTYAIIAISFIVFVISIIFSKAIMGELAFKPIYLSFESFPQLYTLFSSMFLHSIVSPLHIIFNMFMFLLIAPNFENRIGAKKFLAIYIVTGFCAAIAHSLIAPFFSNNPEISKIGLVGASGAIAGVLGAYALSYPRDMVFFPVFFIIRMPVIYAGIIFLVMQTLFIVMPGESNVAYSAHIGGFIAGIILAAIFIRKKGPALNEPVTREQRIYNSYSPQRPRKIDFSELKKLATTRELKEMLGKIKDENVPQVRDIWLEHFLEKINCPKCGSSLNHFDRKIWCEKCDFRSKY